MKECPACGSKEIYVNIKGYVQCLRCGFSRYGVERPNYGKKTVYIKKDERRK